MPENKTLSTSGTKGLDRKLLATILELEFIVNRELDGLAKNLLDELNRSTNSKEVIDIVKFNTRAEAVIDKFYSAYEIQVIKHASVGSEYKVGQGVKVLKPILFRAGYTNTILRMEAKQADYKTYASTILNSTTRRTSASGSRYAYNFIEDMKTARKGTSTVIRSIVENAVREGKGSKDIAKIIEAHIKPTGVNNVKPFDEVRKRSTKPRPEVLRGIKPGSVQYNALRIARTEAAHVYRQSTVDFYKTEDYVAGFKWVLSNRHPEGDICDDWASVTLYKKDGSNLPNGHPNCLCDTQAVPLSDAKLRGLDLD